jgi:3-hydroxybutyryl-CoA dehydrogenase
MNIKTIAVIGAGIMGTDVALDLASYGYPVILKDLDNQILEKAGENQKGFQTVQDDEKGTESSNHRRYPG